MTDHDQRGGEKREQHRNFAPNPNPNNLSELDPELDIDPLTDVKTVAQTPTDDEDIVPLPEAEDGSRAGDYDRTTGAAHPSAKTD